MYKHEGCGGQLVPDRTGGLKSAVLKCRKCGWKVSTGLSYLHFEIAADRKLRQRQARAEEE